jgi:hypothetical protein
MREATGKFNINSQQIGHQRNRIVDSTLDWIQSASDDPHDPLLGSRLACLGCELNT